MRRFTVVCLLLAVILLGICSFALAEESEEIPVHYEKGTVLSIKEEKQEDQGAYSFIGTPQLIKIRLDSGPEKGKVVNTVNYLAGDSPYDIRVQTGDRVVVAVINDLGKNSYSISDFYRFDYMYFLLGLFILSLVLFGGWVGFKSIFVIGFSMLLIFQFFIGQVLAAQWNLILLTLLVSAIITVVTQLTVSGWSCKTWGAMLGTLSGVLIAALLSHLAIYLMHLTGIDSEEAMLLKTNLASEINFQGLLFSGIVLGALGAVMDVAISIASAQQELKLNQPNLNFSQLFVSGMNVGKDVMGTMSNTLILAYTGSSLPLILLIASQQDVSLLKILNLNAIMTEIVRALTGSIGLICAIPFTALITSWLLTKK